MRKFLVSLAILGVAVLGGNLYADDDVNQPADITLPANTKAANLSAAEMQSQSGQLLAQMRNVLKQVVGMQEAARKQKDLIKLNCVNDKLLQVKKLLNIGEAARTEMTEAIAKDDTEARTHQFIVITVASEKVDVLKGEASACIGDDLAFVGPTEVDVGRPDIIDDPTDDDPFDVSVSDCDALDGCIDIERPNFASPFL